MIFVNAGMSKKYSTFRVQYCPCWHLLVNKGLMVDISIPIHIPININCVKVSVQLLLLISLFAHIGYNPIEQHNILTIHVNYIKNNILEKNKKNKYIITAKQVKRYCYYITYYI